MLLKLKCAEARERARLNCKLTSDMKQGRSTCVWMARAIHNVESRVQGPRSKARMYIRVTGGLKIKRKLSSILSNISMLIVGSGLLSIVRGEGGLQFAIKCDWTEGKSN